MLNETTHIVELRVENVKRIKAATIRPDGSFIQITGKNGQGKTSILDAITMVLGGKGTIPPKPVREGENEAFVVADLGDKIVKRTFKADGSSTITVTNHQGAKFGSPQALLDSLVGELTFDPLHFSRMEPKQQVATLKKVAGLDFDELDSLRAGAFSERTVVNREVKEAEAQLNAYPAVEAPDEELSLSELSEKLRAAQDQMQNNGSIRGNAERLKADKEATERQVRAKVDSAERHVHQLEQELAQAKERLEKEKSDGEVATKSATTNLRIAEEAVAVLQDPDTSGLLNEIDSLEQTNKLVRQKKERRRLEAKVKELRDKSVDLTVKIASYDQQKEDALVKANLPVPGLGFSADGITLNGLPFQQACSSEQLRTSVAMGLALNPKLKVMLVRDGSLLDSNGRAMLAQMAEEHGAQVWMERATDGEDIGIVIEDGNVKSTEAPAVE